MEAIKTVGFVSQTCSITIIKIHPFIVGPSVQNISSYEATVSLCKAPSDKE